MLLALLHPERLGRPALCFFCALTVAFHAIVRVSVLNVFPDFSALPQAPFVVPACLQLTTAMRINMLYAYTVYF